MIVLDTNVISEAMKPAANPAVRAWLNEQVAETLYLTSVTLAEMLFGIAVLPAGRRRNSLTRTLDDLLGLFGDRVLPFDSPTAQAFALFPQSISARSFADSQQSAPLTADPLPPTLAKCSQLSL